MSKRVNLKAIHFDGDATQPPVVNTTVNSDLAIMSDQSVFTWSDSTSISTGENHKPFSMSCWFNTLANSNPAKKFGTLMAKFSSGAAVSPDTNATEWLFMVKNQTGQIHFALYDSLFHGTVNKITLTTPSIITNNQWEHVVVTFNGNPQNFLVTEVGFGGLFAADGIGPLGFSVYHNGQLVNHADKVSNFEGTNTKGQVSDGYVITRNTAGVVTLGGVHYDSTTTADHFDTLFEGKIADSCIFNKELSAAEVQELYNNGKVKDMTKHSAYDSLISWWKMGDDLDHSGTNGIIDYVSGFHGSLHGQAFIGTDPSLPTDRIGNNNVSIPSSWGRTRQPKNLAGDHQVYIHGGISGDMPTADPTLATDGYATENQGLLHLYWKVATTTATVTCFGYNYASGEWSELEDAQGNPVTLSVTADSADIYRVFEIAGTDRVYFKKSGTMASTDLFAAAASTFSERKK